MLQVSGIIGISGKTPVDEVRGDKGGSFFNFVVVSSDPDTGKKTSYNASMWVPEKERVKWREELQGGHVFHMQLGYWVMQPYDGGKYPIPKLKVNRYSLKRMTTPYWFKATEGDKDG